MTTQRHSYREALAAAEAFRRLFPPDIYERWEFGGSLRRRCGDVGDLEHVVIAAFADVPSRDLFATPERVNVLWQRADQLVQQGLLARHLYANGQRWGPKYRGCDFAHAGRVHLHEIFCADVDNWGSTLAIRTGPAEFSKRLVTGLLRNGRRNKDGAVWECEQCHPCDGPDCKKCGGTGLEPHDRIPCPTEAAYFQLTGIGYLEPEARR